jgi:N-acetylmuramoyl-L-alanine amidase
MIKSRKLKTFLFTIAFSLISAQVAHAASYTVVSGDSLFIISRLFNTSVTALRQNNSLTSDVIHPGQRLNVQAPTYTVRSGDSLFLIASRHGITLDALRKANNQWNNVIHPGQVLLIPSAGAAVQTPSSGTVVQAPPAPQVSVIPYTAADLDLLARLIRAEAENQTHTARVAVGAVVINRVRSNLFPNTINSVIYQREHGYYQFCPVQNGMISRPARQADIDAALEALRGNDPTRGALFFYDDSATNKWLLSRTVAYRDGRMIFAY